MIRLLFTIICIFDFPFNFRQWSSFVIHLAQFGWNLILIWRNYWADILFGEILEINSILFAMIKKDHR